MSKAFSLEGIEMTLASSHFGHLLSETLLLPTMLAIASQAGLSRIVLVTSGLLYWHVIFVLTKIVRVGKSCSGTSRRRIRQRSNCGELLQPFTAFPASIEVLAEGRPHFRSGAPSWSRKSRCSRPAGIRSSS